MMISGVSLLPTKVRRDDRSHREEPGDCEEGGGIERIAIGYALDASRSRGTGTVVMSCTSRPSRPLEASATTRSPASTPERT